MDRIALNSVDLSALSNPMQDMTAKLSLDVAKTTDRLLAEGISKHLGEKWSVGDVRGRLRAFTYRHRPYTDYAFDGHLILRLYPGELQQEGFKYTWVQNYQKFG